MRTLSVQKHSKEADLEQSAGEDAFEYLETDDEFHTNRLEVAHV